MRLLVAKEEKGGESRRERESRKGRGEKVGGRNRSTRKSREKDCFSASKPSLSKDFRNFAPILAHVLKDIQPTQERIPQKQQPYIL